VTLTGNWTKGKMDGEFVVSIKGKAVGRYTMKNGTGTELTFHRAKRIATETRWVRGAREGGYRELDPKGRDVVVGEYKNDARDGAWIRYDREGAVVREVSYAAGKRDGAYVESNDGAPVVTATFAAGARDGAYREMRADGTPAVVGEYRNDRKHGEWLRYAPGGVLVVRETWVDGLLDGPYLRYHADGAVSVKGSFAAGRRTGTWTEFRPDGTEAGIQEYRP
jgi:antitoxin component YwqK of YwqJK toxin-antitoxin module